MNNDSDPFDKINAGNKVKQTTKPYKLYVQKETENPFPRSGHRIVSDDHNLYVFGGYNPRRTLKNDRSPILPDIWKYNFASHSWKKMQCTNVPHEVASSAVLLIGRQLIIFGGTDYPFGGLKCSNRLWVVNLESEDEICKCIEITGTGDIPLALYGHCIFHYNDYLYTIGGTSGFDYYLDVHRLNIKTCVWQQVYRTSGDEFQGPRPRYRHEIAVYNHCVYVFGGCEYNTIYDFKELPVLNLSNHTWSKVQTVGTECNTADSNYPLPRKYFSLVQDPEDPANIFITAGINGEALTDCWAINLDTLQWKRLEKLELHSGTYFHATAIAPNGRMTHFGGVEMRQQSNTPTRTNRISFAWIRIPSLQDICWDVVTSLYRKKQISKDDICWLLPRSRVKILENNTEGEIAME